MKRKIYWSIYKGHAHYTFDKEQLFADWGNAKHLFDNIERLEIRFYEMEADITDELFLDLINKKPFQHNMLGEGYRRAKQIYPPQETA